MQLSFLEAGLYIKLSELVFEGYTIPLDPRAACNLIGGRANPRQYETVLKALVKIGVVIADDSSGRLRVPLAEGFVASAVGNLRAKSKHARNRQRSGGALGVESEWSPDGVGVHSGWSPGEQEVDSEFTHDEPWVDHE